jgi:hypothetical protein
MHFTPDVELNASDRWTSTAVPPCTGPLLGVRYRIAAALTTLKSTSPIDSTRPPFKLNATEKLPTLSGGSRHTTRVDDSKMASWLLLNPKRHCRSLLLVKCDPTTVAARDAMSA